MSKILIGVLGIFLVTVFLFVTIEEERNYRERPVPITVEKPVKLDPYVETNKYRISQGLPALIRSDTLVATAKYKCLDMVERNYFSHEGADEYLAHLGHASENLSRNNQNPVKAWIESESHRLNIVGNWTYMGIYECEDENLYHVQHFSN